MEADKAKVEEDGNPWLTGTDVDAWILPPIAEACDRGWRVVSTVSTFSYHALYAEQYAGAKPLSIQTPATYSPCRHGLGTWWISVACL